VILKRLQALMPPPRDPVDPGKPGGWAGVWRAVGTRLPEDFVEFIDTYGSGEVCHWMNVHNPFSSAETEAFVPHMLAALGAFRVLKESDPNAIPYPIHFEPQGLIPWGTSIDGDEFCWLAKGLPSEWPVVVICRHAAPEKYEVGMGAFLEKALAGTLESAAWPEDAQVTFLPSRRAG
jgi:hypothetical protein